MEERLLGVRQLKKSKVMWGGLESFTRSSPRELAQKDGERAGRQPLGSRGGKLGPTSHHGAEKSSQTLQASFTLGG